MNDMAKLPTWKGFDTAKWIRGFASQSHHDRLMSCVEDGSCMNMVVDTALAALELDEELRRRSTDADTLNSLRVEKAERERGEAQAVARAMLAAMDGFCPLCSGSNYQHDELCSYPKAVPE